MLENYPSIESAMIKNIRRKYNDKWKLFIRSSLRNIDYFTSIPDSCLEELTYLLEYKNINSGDYLFRKGTLWNNIYIIASGEIDIQLGNNKFEITLDTLYAGWTIGLYYCLTSDDYVCSAKAKTDCNIIKLPFEKVIELRKTNEYLDYTMSWSEEYIIKNDLPYWDYRFYRGDICKIPPIEKFRKGVRRIMGIVRTYRASAFTKLLERAQKFVREK